MSSIVTCSYFHCNSFYFLWMHAQEFKLWCFSD
uniref:Uncharacterized protein n=1 Tax=Arundo donax TaxID=35708 RepID=A0A0A9B1P5_ARUDO